VVSGSYRTSYDAMYYDDAQRETFEENVGSNGGSAWARPSTPDASDADLLVTLTTYNSRGLEATSTDPRGIVGATFYNLLGETTETIADDTDGTPTADTNQTTDFNYNGSGNLLRRDRSLRRSGSTLGRRSRARIRTVVNSGLGAEGIPKSDLKRMSDGKFSHIGYSLCVVWPTTRKKVEPERASEPAFMSNHVCPTPIGFFRTSFGGAP
jgi:YD repeat-containing protein